MREEDDIFNILPGPHRVQPGKYSDLGSASDFWVGQLKLTINLKSMFQSQNSRGSLMISCRLLGSALLALLRVKR